VGSAREDLSPANRGRCQETTIHELESLDYKAGQLSLSKRRSEGGDRLSEDLASRVSVLAVSSRFERSRVFRGGSNTAIQGYAKLYVCEDRAYVHRLGINPESRPTPEETEIIARLRLAVSQFLECDYFFDVYDEIDAKEEGVEFQPSVCETHFKRNLRLDNLARRYGNACNVFLRGAACTYLAAILKEDCPDTL
jgi:hypothetical protein